MTSTKEHTKLLAKFHVQTTSAIVDLGSTSKNEMPLPDGYEPREVDILCGRGKGSYNRAGHKRYLAVVEALFPKFISAKSRIDKSNVFDEIIAEVQSERFGCAKFIKSVNKKWVEISKDEARGKVGHALRVMKAEFLQRAKAKGSDGTKRNGKKSKSAAKQSNPPIPKKIYIRSMAKYIPSTQLLSDSCHTIQSGPCVESENKVCSTEEYPQNSVAWTVAFETEMPDCDEISCVTLKESIRSDGDAPQTKKQQNNTAFCPSSALQYLSVLSSSDLVAKPHCDDLSCGSSKYSPEIFSDGSSSNQQHQNKHESMSMVPCCDGLPTLPLTGILNDVPHPDEIDFDSLF